MNDTWTDKLREAVLTLLREAYVGPSDPTSTWFVDNEPNSGLLGILTSTSAIEASQPALDGTTVAGHTNHLCFALDLANRAFRGDDLYDTADWSESWSVHEVDSAQWDRLLARLRHEYDLVVEVLSPDAIGEMDQATLNSTLALIAHGAWHLGAVRSILAAVRSQMH
jgi:hypothetical protein